MRKLFYAMSMLLTMAFVWTGCSDTEPTTVEKFTVTFDSQGGSDVAPLTINKGAKITKPTDPTKETLIFAGWFKETALTTKWDFSSDVVTADITLYAKWTTVEYTVSFNTNGGSAIESLKIAEGAMFIAPLPPSKTDRAFDGWYKESALTTKWNFSSDVVTTDITLYAKWTKITAESLYALINEARGIIQYNYTKESYNAMDEARRAASDVIGNDGSTHDQIISAYTELQAAINALVALPVREPASIELNKDPVDGFIYARPGENFSINGYAVDAKGEDATDRRVTFTYSEKELNTWIEGDITINENGIQFLAKSALTAGETIEVTIASAAKPAIFMTVALKVAAEGELKKKFIDAVNALPEPGKVSYDDWEEIDMARDIYDVLTPEDREEEDVKVAQEKLTKCDDALESLPLRLNYSFNGNVCTLIMNDFGELMTLKADFVAERAFPQGTYTTQDWEDEEADGIYSKMRLEFTTEKDGANWYRYSSNADGTNPSEWQVGDAFTYTFTGDKAKGVFFILDINEAKEPVDGK